VTRAKQKKPGLWQELKEISMFFQGRDEVHKTLRRVIKRLDKAGIPYVVVGGLAVKAHGYRRTTDDVDLLLTPQGLEEFRTRFVPKNYEQAGQRKRRFVDKVNHITLGILVTGGFPGNGAPGPVSFPDPNNVRQLFEDIPFLDLPTLIQLKLAARRYQDFADVVHLIRDNNLDEPFQDKLDPSVRGDFIECLEEKRREDEYQERLGGT
jgi:hypothetical protein